NRPSDGAERSVPNTILVFSSAPTGPIASVTVRPDSPRIYATQSTGFTVFGQDAAYNPVPFDRAAIAWSVSGATGTFDASGRFTAATAGTATISATINGVSGTARLTVIADTSSPKASAPVVRLLPGTQLGATVPVNVSWDEASDVGLGVVDYELAQNVNAKGWKPLPSGSPLNRNA